MSTGYAQAGQAELKRVAPAAALNVRFTSTPAVRFAQRADIGRNENFRV